MLEANVYAQLANRVYMRTDENRIPVPSGWSELQYVGNDQISGLSAGIYQNGSDIVICR